MVWVEVGQKSATVVEDPLSRDRVCPRGHHRSDAELTECPNGVARQVKPGAARLTRICPLHDLGSDASPLQGMSQRKAGDTGTHDQQAQRRYPRGRMFRFARNRLSGSYLLLTATSRSKLAP